MAFFQKAQVRWNGLIDRIKEPNVRSDSQVSEGHCQLQTTQYQECPLVGVSSLANGCFDLVCDGGFLKYNICEFESPGQRRDRMPRLRINEFLPPAVQYACLHWVSHIEYVEPKIMDGGRVHRFLQRSFLHWLEALSLLGKAAEAIPLIEELIGYVDVSTQRTDLCFPC